jgi:acetyl-CoA carboxylase biotin carboxyl carrier protein
MPEADADNLSDLEKLRQMVELMEKHDLSEISLRKGEEHWRLRRGGFQAPTAAFAPPPAALAPPPPPVKGAAAVPEAKAEPPGEHLLEIKSPTVGTYYASPSPEDPAFVTVGSKVSPSTVVCLIEAMKVFNQIAAETSGTIAAILVKSGDAVEFGQPLFKVRP